MAGQARTITIMLLLHIILKLIYRTKLATTFRRLASKCYVFIAQVKKTSNFTYLHTKVIEAEVTKNWLHM